jgi:hypothetical protein
MLTTEAKRIREKIKKGTVRAVEIKERRDEEGDEVMRG